MILKKCLSCGEYNLTNKCKKCSFECSEVGYKFKKIRDAPKDSAKYFFDKRK
jgi:hypothetical protein